MNVLFSYHSKIIKINVYNHYYCKLWLLLLSLLSLLLAVHVYYYHYCNYLVFQNKKYELGMNYI